MILEILTDGTNGFLPAKIASQRYQHIPPFEISQESIVLFSSQIAALLPLWIRCRHHIHVGWHSSAAAATAIQRAGVVVDVRAPLSKHTVHMFDVLLVLVGETELVLFDKEVRDVLKSFRVCVV